MIFISTGTIHFPFDRLEKLSSHITSHAKDEKIIFQHGYTPILRTKNNVEFINFCSMKEFERYLKQARLIITHGGPATIYQSLYLGRKPWVVPRMKRYHEHVNDHQLLFAQYLHKKHLIYLFQDNLEKMIQVGSPQLPKMQTKSKNKIISKLDHFLIS